MAVVSNTETVIKEILDLEKNDCEDSRLLWLSPDTHEEYNKLVLGISKKLDILHYGIPKNPSYVVFKTSNNEYSLYPDRERTPENDIYHLCKMKVGTDYSNVWNPNIYDKFEMSDGLKTIDITDLVNLEDVYLDGLFG